MYYNSQFFRNCVPRLPARNLSRMMRPPPGNCAKGTRMHVRLDEREKLLRWQTRK